MPETCSFAGQKEEEPKFVVRGASQVRSIISIFHLLADRYAFKGIQISGNSIPFLIDVKLKNQPSLNERINNLNLSTMKVVEEGSIEDVFLSGAWEEYIKIGLISSNSLDSETAFQEGMQKAVSLLLSKVKRVWILLETPALDRSVLRWLALHANDQSEIWIDNPFPGRATRLRPFFDRLSKQPGVQLLDPLPYLCRADGKCLIAHKGKAVYMDEYHLTASGSLLLEDMLKPAFEVMTSNSKVK